MLIPSLPCPLPLLDIAPCNISPHPPLVGAGRNKFFHSAADVLKLTKKSIVFFDDSILGDFFDEYLHLTVMIACLRLDSQSSPVNFCAQAADFVSTKFPI